jgi:hypothetical protein
MHNMLLHHLLLFWIVRHLESRMYVIYVQKFSSFLSEGTPILGYKEQEADTF